MVLSELLPSERVFCREEEDTDGGFDGSPTPLLESGKGFKEPEDCDDVTSFLEMGTATEMD